MKVFHMRLRELYNMLRSLNVQKFGRKDFAEFLGVSLGKANGWLDGGGTPDIDTIKELAAHTGLSILWLIGVSDDMYAIPPDELRLPAAAKEEYKFLVHYLKFKYSVQLGRDSIENEFMKDTKLLEEKEE